jgi:hypothetical protein
MPTTNFKGKLKTLVPVNIWQILRVVKYNLHFAGTEQFATFALRMKASMPSSTFQKKILRKMAFDRDPLLTLYADKVMVREFVKERVGLKYLTTSFGEFHSIESLKRISFPKNFVLKSNHGSGGSVICWEGAPRGVKLPKDLSNVSWEKFLVHPDDLDWVDLTNLADKWIKLNYYWTLGRFPEWAYKNIYPMLLAEELLMDNNKLPLDYKFQMIEGKCAFIQVDVARYGHHQRNLYSEEWIKLDAKTPHPPVSEYLQPPTSLPEMLQVAKELSKGIDFIRVDLYSINGRVIFGELTNYPNGGLVEIWPRSLSVDLAKNWVQIY